MRQVNKLKQIRFFRSAYFLRECLKLFFSFKPISFVKNYFWYHKDYLKFKRELKLNNASHNIYALYPSIADKTSSTPLDPIYFYQDCWAAEKIFKLKPSHHYDVGSAATTIGILSQYVPTTMIDIRPLPLSLPNLFFKEGSILNLPIPENSLESISSLCVIEHIGLGRYGDPIDPIGSEKAIKELIRVTKPGGTILISVPVDSENRIFFNSHRAFTPKYILEQFVKCKLLEEKYIFENKMIDRFTPSSKSYVVGLFMFSKEEG